MSDDANTCALIQLLLNSQQLHAEYNAIPHTSFEPEAVSHFDVVFLDEIYGGNSYLKTLGSLSHPFATNIILLLDDNNLRNIVTSLPQAIRSGVNHVAFRSELSQRSILELIFNEPISVDQSTFKQHANYPINKPSSKEYLAGNHSTHLLAQKDKTNGYPYGHFIEHSLNLDLINQRIHIKSSKGSPITDKTDLLLSLENWFIMIDSQGKHLFEELINNAKNYEPIKKSFSFQFIETDGNHIEVELNHIRIQNNGQGTAESVTGMLCIQPETPDPVESSFTDESFYEPHERRDNIWKNVAHSLPMMCVLLDENAIIKKIINCKSDDLHFFPNVEVGQFVSNTEELSCPENFQESILRTLNTGKEQKHRLTYASPQGLRWLDTHLTRLKGDAGLSRQVVLTAFDVTENKREYQHLLKEYDALSKILEDAPILFFQKDPDGRYLRANRAFCDMFELKPETLLGRNDKEIFGQSHTELNKITQRSLQTPNKPKMYEYHDTIQEQPFQFQWHIITLKQPTNRKIESIVGFGTAIHIESNASETPENSENKIIELESSSPLAGEKTLQLTGALNQDFSEIIKSITKYTEMAITHANKNRDEKLMTRLNEVVSTSQHALDVITSDQSQSNDKSQNVELKPLVSDIINMMQPTLPKNVDFDVDIDSAKGSANINQAALKKIVMAMLVNARKTAESNIQIKDGKANKQKIKLTLSNIHHEEKDCTTSEEKLNGEYLELAVHTENEKLSDQEFQNLINTAREATQKQQENSVVGLAQANDGHTIIEQNDGTLSLKLLFSRI